MNRIFISYRREDSSGHAGRVRDSLRARLGVEVFQDVDSIRDGDLFSEALRRALDTCQVGLVVIGRTWLTATDERGFRRIDDPGDWVHTETRMLLDRKIRVIPLLVAGTTMPRASELPEVLRPLAERQARELRDTAWDTDVQTLIDRLQDILGNAVESPRQRGHRRRFIGLAVAGLVALATIGGFFYSSLRTRNDVNGSAEKPHGTSSVAAVRDPPSNAKLVAGEPASKENRDEASTLPIVLTRGAPPDPTVPSENFELAFDLLARRANSAGFSSLAESAELTSGVDDYCVVVRPDSHGYLYVFQQDSSGHIQWLFPRNAFAYSSGSNPVKGGETVTIPSDPSRVLYLDEIVGSERVFAVFSATRWSALEKALEMSGAGAPQAVGDALGNDRGVGGIRRTSPSTVAAAAAKVLDKVRYRLPGPTEMVRSVGHFLVISRSFRHVHLE